MDPQTAFLVVSLMMIANGAILGLVHRDLQPALRPSAFSWRFATLLLSSAYILFGLMRQLPIGLVLPVANALAVLGLTFFWRALRQFYGQPDRLWMLLPLAAQIPISLWFTLIQPDFGIRVQLTMLIWFVLLLASAVTLLSDKRTDEALSRRVLAGLFVLLACFCVFRLMYYTLYPPASNQTLLDTAYWINALTPLVLGLVPAIGTTAFLLMCSERLRRQLEDAAATDFLTGLPNRRTLSRQGDDSFTAARLHGAGLAVLLIDIDHFKAINDTYGHDAGDQALQHVARRLAENSRGTSQPSRHGGEEFVILIDRVDLEQARLAGERLRQAIADSPIPVGDQQLHLTISIGIAIQKLEDTNFEKLLSRADAALYAAKKNGRNRVEVAP